MTEPSVRAPPFQTESVTTDQLAGLTDAGLKALGLALADRKRFLAAMVRSPPTPPVDPSSLGERLDLEDDMAAIQYHRDCCGTATARYGRENARFRR